MNYTLVNTEILENCDENLAVGTVCRRWKYALFLQWRGAFSADTWSVLSITDTSHAASFWRYWSIRSVWASNTTTRYRLMLSLNCSSSSSSYLPYSCWAGRATIDMLHLKESDWTMAHCYFYYFLQ